MWHLRLGNLPRTRKWNEVVGLIQGDGDATAIAAGSLDAAQSSCCTRPTTKG
jgi:hypothetical protein